CVRASGPSVARREAAVESSRSMPAAGGRGARVFVGRDRELAELEAHLAAAATGRGGLVLLGGEPGSGQARLPGRLGVRRPAPGVVALWGRCWEEGGAPAYWPWLQILRAGLRHDDPARVVSAIGAQAALLQTLVPELPGGARAPRAALPAAGLDSEHRRFALFDALPPR